MRPALFLLGGRRLTWKISSFTRIGKQDRTRQLYIEDHAVTVRMVAARQAVPIQAMEDGMDLFQLPRWLKVRLRHCLEWCFGRPIGASELGERLSIAFALSSE